MVNVSAELVGETVIADDSGLMVDALDGAGCQFKRGGQHFTAYAD